MKKIAIACLAGLVLTAPALAGWNGAQWGSSPEAAAAAVPGGALHDPVQSEIFEWEGRQLYPRVRAPITIGETDLTANLLFDDAGSLVGVVASPADATQCPAIGAELETQYGAGQDFGSDFAAITEWIGADGNALRLTHVEAAGICNLFIAPIAAG